jgi:hypothetical protein
MQTMIEKLRLIADAIEQGKDVETRGSYSGTNAGSEATIGWKQMGVPHVHVWTGNEYRIAPDKPRVRKYNFCSNSQDLVVGEVIELTEDVINTLMIYGSQEVREALKAAGVEI